MNNKTTGTWWIGGRGYPKPKTTNKEIDHAKQKNIKNEFENRAGIYRTKKDTSDN